jgi:hypothetical protein
MTIFEGLMTHAAARGLLATALLAYVSQSPPVE